MKMQLLFATQERHSEGTIYLYLIAEHKGWNCILENKLSAVFILLQFSQRKITVNQSKENNCGSEQRDAE